MFNDFAGWLRVLSFNKHATPLGGLPYGYPSCCTLCDSRVANPIGKGCDVEVLTCPEPNKQSMSCGLSWAQCTTATLDVLALPDSQVDLLWLSLWLSLWLLLLLLLLLLSNGTA